MPLQYIPGVPVPWPVASLVTSVAAMTISVGPLLLGSAAAAQSTQSAVNTLTAQLNDVIAVLKTAGIMRSA